MKIQIDNIERYGTDYCRITLEKIVWDKYEFRRIDVKTSHIDIAIEKLFAHKLYWINTPIRHIVKQKIEKTILWERYYKALNY